MAEHFMTVVVSCYSNALYLLPPITQRLSNGGYIRDKKLSSDLCCIVYYDYAQFVELTDGAGFCVFVNWG